MVIERRQRVRAARPYKRKLGSLAEISRFERVRGGPGRTRTCNQTVMSAVYFIGNIDFAFQPRMFTILLAKLLVEQAAHVLAIIIAVDLMNAGPNQHAPSGETPDWSPVEVAAPIER